MRPLPPASGALPPSLREREAERDPGGERERERDARLRAKNPDFLGNQPIAAGRVMG